MFLNFCQKKFISVTILLHDCFILIKKTFKIYYIILKGLNVNSPVQSAGKTKQHLKKNP